jgi:hypothetical protein
VIRLPDNILIKLLLVTKGKKLLSRVIPLLFQEQYQYLFLFFMRNLSVLQILFSQQSMDMDEEKAINQLFDNVTSKIGTLILPHLIYALDTLTFYHSTSLLELFQAEVRFLLTFSLSLDNRLLTFLPSSSGNRKPFRSSQRCYTEHLRLLHLNFEPRWMLCT